MNQKILLKSLEYFITPAIRNSKERFNRMVQIFLTSTKGHQKERYGSKEFINYYIL